MWQEDGSDPKQLQYVYQLEPYGGGRVGVVVSCLAFLLWEPDLNPTGGTMLIEVSWQSG